MVKSPTIPNVPLDVPANLRAFLESTRETLQVMAGHRGDKLEKAVTFRDLAGVSKQIGVLRGALSALESLKPGGSLDTFEPVPNVADFKVTSTFTANSLAWQPASFKGYQFSRVYRSSSADFGQAAIIAESATSAFVDIVGPKTEFYYWVQHVGSGYRDPRLPDGQDTSPEFPPTLTPPASGAVKVLPVSGAVSPVAVGRTPAEFDEIKDQIKNDLLSRVDEINRQFDAALDRLEDFFNGAGAGDFLTALGSLDAQINALNSSYSSLAKSLFEAELSLHAERKDRAQDVAFTQRRVTETRTDLGNLAREFNLVYADFYNIDGYLSARVTEINEAIANLDSATATRFAEMLTRVQTMDTETRAVIQQLQQTTSDADRALALSVQNLDADFRQADQAANARINQVSTALATGVGSWAERSTSIEASLATERSRINTVEQAISSNGSVFATVGSMLSATRSDLQGQISSAYAAAVSYVANDTNGVVSQTISSYRVSRPGGGTASLDTLASVAYNVSGEYSALWGVRSTVGQTTAGVSLYNDGQKTSFIVNAQQFAIHQGSGSSLTVPFSFQFAWVSTEGFVWSTTQTDYPPGVSSPAGNATWSWRQTLILDNAYIKQAAILRLAAKTITAEKIDATGRVRSGLFSGGVIELSSVQGVWPIIQARGTSKTLEIDPNHPSAVWFGDTTYASSVTYNEQTLTPTVAHRGKSRTNANFALTSDGGVFIRRDSGGFSCLHNPNETFFMWFGPTAAADNPTYANAVWYLDNKGRYPLPVVTKSANFIFGPGTGWRSSTVTHLCQGSPISITMTASININTMVPKTYVGSNRADTWAVQLAIYVAGRQESVQTVQFPVVYESGGQFDAVIYGGTSLTREVTVYASPGEQQIYMTAQLITGIVPAAQLTDLESQTAGFRTFEVKDF